MSETTWDSHSVPDIYSYMETYGQAAAEFASRFGRNASKQFSDVKKDVLKHAEASAHAAAAFAFSYPSGHFAAAFFLSLYQERFLFPSDRRTPGENGLKEMVLPEELAKAGVQERRIVEAANGNQPIAVWEKKAEKGKPHYILFHGQAGHWADGGPAPKERYDSPNVGRGNGLEYLQAAAETGAGFTAVCLPGFGHTPGEPGEKAFNQAIDAVLDDLQKKGVLDGPIIVGGESLGSASALEAARKLLQRGYDPNRLQVDMMNPFTSMAEVAAESFDKIPKLKHLPHFSAKFLDDYVLRHHFDNREKLAEIAKIGQGMTIHIGTSTKDSKIDHHHSEDLEKLARDYGLKVERSLFPDADHRSWSPAKLLAKSLRIYNRNQGIENDPALLERLENHNYCLFVNDVEIDASNGKVNGKANGKVNGKANGGDWQSKISPSADVSANGHDKEGHAERTKKRQLPPSGSSPRYPARG